MIKFWINPPTPENIPLETFFSSKNKFWDPARLNNNGLLLTYYTPEKKVLQIEFNDIRINKKLLDIGFKI